MVHLMLKTRLKKKHFNIFICMKELTEGKKDAK